jgi:hypothetical protein
MGYFDYSYDDPNGLGTGFGDGSSASSGGVSADNSGSSWYDKIPWAQVGGSVLNFLGAGLAGGKQQQMSQAEIDERKREFDLSRGDTNASKGASLASRNAMLPLIDRGFSGLTARFAQGPGTFGNVGNQNRQIAASAAAYQPGQNPSINTLGNEWQGVLNRFLGAGGAGQSAYDQQTATANRSAMDAGLDASYSTAPPAAPVSTGAGAPAPTAPAADPNDHTRADAINAHQTTYRDNQGVVRNTRTGQPV